MTTILRTLALLGVLMIAACGSNPNVPPEVQLEVMQYTDGVNPYEIGTSDPQALTTAPYAIDYELESNPGVVLSQGGEASDMSFAYGLLMRVEQRGGDVHNALRYRRGTGQVLADWRQGGCLPGEQPLPTTSTAANPCAP